MIYLLITFFVRENIIPAYIFLVKDHSKYFYIGVMTALNGMTQVVTSPVISILLDKYNFPRAR